MKVYKTESEMKAYAEEQSETIVIRAYTDGNSSDVRRATSKVEAEIIKNIIYGGLLAMNQYTSNDIARPAIDACEYIGNLMIPEMNGYDTIFCPLDLFDWRQTK